MRGGREREKGERGGRERGGSERRKREEEERGGRGGGEGKLESFNKPYSFAAVLHRAM